MPEKEGPPRGPCTSALSMGTGTRGSPSCGCVVLLSFMFLCFVVSFPNNLAWCCMGSQASPAARVGPRAQAGLCPGISTVPLRLAQCSSALPAVALGPEKVEGNRVFLFAFAKAGTPGCLHTSFPWVQACAERGAPVRPADAPALEAATLSSPSPSFLTCPSVCCQQQGTDASPIA